MNSTVDAKEGNLKMITPIHISSLISMQRRFVPQFSS